MKPKHRAYDLARQAVLVARSTVEPGKPPAAALLKAEEELRTAEAAVDAELQAAWERNRQAVAAAKTAAFEARREQARVETACGTEARRREPRHPVLNEAERVAVTEARAQVDAAFAAHEEALAAFKAGVTPEQLEAV